MKRATLDLDEAIRHFGRVSKLDDIICNIIDRIDDIDDDTHEAKENAILQACDEELIYDADQWAIIMEYSSPSKPKSFDEAFEDFFSELYQSIDWEDEEEVE